MSLTLVGGALYVVARIDKWHIPHMLKPGRSPNTEAFQRMGRISAKVQPWEQRIAVAMIAIGVGCGVIFAIAKVVSAVI